MLDNLEQLIRTNAGNVIDQNELIEGKKNYVIKVVTEIFFENLKALYVSNGIKGIMTFLDNGPAKSASFTDITIARLTNTLISKVNISHASSHQIASVIIPVIVSKLVTKTNDRNDPEFSLDKIIDSFNT